ncbi:hypothetical protein BKA67DRAFT_652593 [Truncatella angustata]|uniref:Uncharacterized protein n=1 Tax=Truncatella angustata TaxID=152316 RepID=A0A9P8UWM4_9PEZI|nr:uncharacterized protein BKA67DRAFT_652593 [Truncatella angustata]KAH6659361.1 hypothetical protein BKA67DRAFT_652593 [Truncatella angustata]KAH8195492.1 hypothetical protein TruAng_010344 [Truncatella angustata]
MTAVWGKARRFLLSDEEMGKKDDDHKPAAVNLGLPSPGWHPKRGPQRRSLKRLAIALFVIGLVYLFIHNIPTDLGPAHTSRPAYGGTRKPGATAAHDATRSPTSGTADDAENTATYNGPPKFLDLAASLHAIAGTRGGMLLNKNILFTASSLKSATILLPIACQMGRESRNYVHFALMSRSPINMEELQSINGVDETCQIIFHNARTEHAAIMTDERMEYAAFRAFHHIFMWMHPQAVIVDGSGWEEYFFTKAAAAHAKATGSTLIELPYSSQSLLWMTKLDSRSLRAWDKNHIDILIQAIPGSSGGLIRLLRSLSAADFAATSIPHLTIELPSDITPATKQLLEEFEWPPAHISNPTGAKYVSIRHRISRQSLTEEESSARFLESFWPANPSMSHVLVLSPQVELAPDFFHYLKYTMLEYRYSEASHVQHWDARLFGISLEQPLKQLNGEDQLSPPLSKNKGSEQDISSSFLWQAPTSRAMLFMGEKWMELHDLVSRSLEVQQTSDATPSLLSKKLISTQHPAWLEHALRLSRLRGYWTLYPGEETAKSLVTVHTDLSHIPEEYAKTEEPLKLDDKASEEEIEKVMKKLKTSHDSNLSAGLSLQTLLEAGALRAFGNLPLITFDGTKTDLQGLDELAAKFALAFKTQVGRCNKADTETKRVATSAKDLFCTDD